MIRYLAVSFHVLGEMYATWLFRQQFNNTILRRSVPECVHRFLDVFAVYLGVSRCILGDRPCGYCVVITDPVTARYDTMHRVCCRRGDFGFLGRRYQGEGNLFGTFILRQVDVASQALAEFVRPAR